MKMFDKLRKHKARYPSVADDEYSELSDPALAAMMLLHEARLQTELLKENNKLLKEALAERLPQREQDGS